MGGPTSTGQWDRMFEIGRPEISHIKENSTLLMGIAEGANPREESKAVSTEFFHPCAGLT